MAFSQGINYIGSQMLSPRARIGRNISYKKDLLLSCLLSYPNNRPGQTLVQVWLGLAKGFLKALSFNLSASDMETAKQEHHKVSVCFFTATFQLISVL